MSESPPFVWSQNRPPTPSTIRTSGPIATAPSDVSSGDLSENAGSGTQGQCDAASCSNTWVGQEARHSRVDGSAHSVAHRAAWRVAQRVARRWRGEIIHVMRCFGCLYCQDNLLYLSELLQVLEDSRKANDTQFHPRRMLEQLLKIACLDLEEELQYQILLGFIDSPWPLLEVSKVLLVSNEDFFFPDTNLQQLLWELLFYHMFDMASSISTYEDWLLKYAHDKTFGRIVQDTVPKEDPTSYVDQSQKIQPWKLHWEVPSDVDQPQQNHAYMFLLNETQQHHDSFPNLHIKYMHATVMGMQ